MAVNRGARLRWASIGVRTVVGLGLLAGSTGLLIALARTRPVAERAAGVDEALVARTMALRPVEAPLVYTGYGVARAMAQAEVAAQAQARVVERPAAVEAGLAVSAGDLLVRLDDTEFAQRVRGAAKLVEATEAELDGLLVEEAAIARQIDLAEQEVAIQERDLQRARDIRERGGGSAAEIDARLTLLRRAERELAQMRERQALIPSRRAALQSRLENQRAALAVAEEELSRTRITSPIDGVLQEVMVEEGELLAPGQPVARVVDLRALEVPLRLAASSAGHVAPGDEAPLWVDGPGQRQWPGTVARVSPDVDAAARSIIVYVELRQDAGSDPRTLLRPGQFMVGRVRTSESRRELIVPRRAVQDDTVWVAEPLGDDLARLVRRPVTIARYLEGDFEELAAGERQWAVLESGPAAGELVVLTALSDLVEGATVRLAPGAAGGGGPGGPARAASETGGAR
ncbi:MAG: efflux RND transporter periplasmic adaptor subunit [Phycisphaerales bacterium JB039]